MGPFARATRPPLDVTDPAAWRGRCREIEDIGALPWEIVLEAMKVRAELTDRTPGDDLLWFVWPFGLHPTGSTIHGGRPAHTFEGARFGRPVQLRQGPAAGSSERAAWVSWVRAQTPPFALRSAAGRIAMDGIAPEPVATRLAAWAPAPVWRDVHVASGADGIVVTRTMKATMQPAAWLYDLWLAEHLAGLVGTGVLDAPPTVHPDR